MPNTVSRTLPGVSRKPTPANDGGVFIPPPAGSSAERVETALAVGYPGAFSVTCRTVEQVIRSRLSFWES